MSLMMARMEAVKAAGGIQPQHDQGRAPIFRRRQTAKEIVSGGWADGAVHFQRSELSSWRSRRVLGNDRRRLATGTDDTKRSPE